MQGFVRAPFWDADVCACFNQSDRIIDCEISLLSQPDAFAFSVALEFAFCQSFTVHDGPDVGAGSSEGATRRRAAGVAISVILLGRLF